MGLAIRRAGAGDVAALSRIGADTFTRTFGHLYPEADLQAFLDANYSAQASSALLADPAYAAWLLHEADAVLGYAVAGACGLPHPEAGPDDGELKRLYLLPQLHGSGWGGRLCDTALDWLERDGPRTLWISVWSENLGAQRFYARRGFSKAGEYEFPVGRVRDREFMYRRRPHERPGPPA